MAATNDAAGRDGAERGANKVNQVFEEFADAARAATFSLLDEQKERAAREVATIAGAIRHCARSLDQTDNPTMARYAASAAGQIEHVSELMRERPWSEIVADTEDLARRRPALFVLGTVAAGFLAGCFCAAGSDRRPHSAPRAGEAAAHPGGNAAVPAPAELRDIGSEPMRGAV